MPALSPITPLLRPFRMLVGFALIASAMLFLAACGNLTVSSEELEKQVSTSYTEQSGIEVKSISCDEVSPAEVGSKFTCEATNAGDGKLFIEGEVTAVNEDDEKVEFDWEVVSLEVPGTSYAEAAKQALEQQAGSQLEKIECPEMVKVEENETFRCEVTAPDGSTMGATVTMTDGEGGFDIKVDE
jgi:hypothetical protein